MSSSNNNRDDSDHYQNKVVRFATTVEIEFFDANQSSSQITKNELHYSQVDLQIFQAWAVKCIKKVRTVPQQQELLGAADIIGLERHLSPLLNNEYKLRQKAVVHSVLDEQRRQRILRTCNIQRISRISQDKSRWARENARASGLFLERDMEDDNILNVFSMHNFLKRASPTPPSSSCMSIAQPHSKRRKMGCCPTRSEVCAL